MLSVAESKALGPVLGLELRLVIGMVQCAALMLAALACKRYPTASLPAPTEEGRYGASRLGEGRA
ncbi:MAG TPA: hypothetical protein VH041_05515 [Caldimonas sp.]|nr:hypothetical protein [Caldimonas sp.]HEX4233744.1 hypothetical protein [Caldimonas sp.]